MSILDRKHDTPQPKITRDTMTEQERQMIDAAIDAGRARKYPDDARGRDYITKRRSKMVPDWQRALWLEESDYVHGIERNEE